MQNNLTIWEFSSVYLKCIDRLQLLEQIFQFTLVFILFPLIGISGIILNSFIIVIMPRDSVNVSRVSKIYFITAAIGDSLIMLKNVSLFLIKLSCHFSGRKICANITFANTAYKTLMILWLDGEILSNYSLLFLSAERLSAALDSQRLSMKSKPLSKFLHILYPIILSTLMIYNGIIGLMLFKAEEEAHDTCGAILAIERNSIFLTRLSILAKFLTFTVPVIGSLLLSYLLLRKSKK